jgi:protein SCO1
MRVLCFVCLAVSFFACDSQKKLPFLGEGEHRIPDFAFTNQDGKSITQADFKNKIYVADFFFTSCPTMCPVMNRNLLTVQEAFKNNPEIAFLSHSIDPRHDSVPVLKEYAERLGADTRQWQFVTGKQTDIYRIAKEGYLLTTEKDTISPEKSGGFLHSGALVLIDKYQRIRGMYDGTQKEAVQKLIADIPVLLAESNPQ